jgi:MFS family permease
MYDFVVFGYYATAIGRAFFPAGSAFASLMLSLMTFGAGFLVRPLGAVVLGVYIDRHGRRAGLMLTLGLMAAGTLTLACTPGYATLGLAAPVLVVAGRLLQGFSAGAELGGVSVYLSEIAPPGRKGFYVAWQSASQQAAVVFTALVGVLLGELLSAEDMGRWGWRVPFLLGCGIIPLLLLLRRWMQETEAFRSRPHPARSAELFRTLRGHARVVVLGILLTTMTTVSFYLITAYTPTFGERELSLGTRDVLTVTLCVGASNFVWLPVMGAVSDRVGRRRLLVGFAGLALLTAYPVMAWLTREPSFARLLAVGLWLSFLYAGYNGALVVYLTEIMPAQVRTSAFSLAYSLATALGGFTPAVSTYLIHRTGDPAAPGAWLSLAAGLGLTAALLAGRRASGAAGAGVA